MSDNDLASESASVNSETGTNRRDFLIASTAIGAGLILGSSASQQTIPSTTTQNLEICTLSPIKNEFIYSILYGIRNKIDLYNLQKLAEDQKISPQSYELDCETAATSYLLASLGILNPKTNLPYTSDELIDLIAISEDPQKGIHPRIREIERNDDTSTNHLPPDPYGVMPTPIAEALRGSVLKEDTTHKIYIGNSSKIKSIDDYRNFINWSITNGSPVVFWQCLEQNPEIAELNGAKYPSGEHAGLIVGIGPDNLMYIDPYTFKIYYKSIEDAYNSAKFVDYGLLTVVESQS